MHYNITLNIAKYALKICNKKQKDMQIKGNLLINNFLITYKLL